MKRQTIAFCPALLLAATACGSTEAEPEGPGMSVCGLVSYPDTGRLALAAADANNYTFTSTLMLGEVAVAPRSELSFDWSEVMIDFSKHAVEPAADIDMVSLIVWKLSSAELAVKLNDDDLSQRDFESMVMIYTEDATTSGTLFEFTSFGSDVDREVLLAYLDPNTLDPATHTYTAMASTGTTPGKGTRMIQSFRLDESSTNTHVALNSDSTALQYEVDLTSLQPVEVPTAEAGITIDWAGMTANAMGAEFDPTAITEVIVARYSIDAAELEAQFLDIELIADELYRGNVVSGSSFALADTTSSSGAAFSGIDDGGNWLVALMCGTCTNPAPWFITSLRPCATP